jgi:hypothetical protein
LGLFLTSIGSIGNRDAVGWVCGKQTGERGREWSFSLCVCGMGLWETKMQWRWFFFFLRKKKINNLKMIILIK